MRTHPTSRILGALVALMLLAAPTMALCLECVTGLCGRSGSVANAMHETHGPRGHEEGETADGEALNDAAMSSVHCDSAKPASDGSRVGAEAEASAGQAQAQALVLSADCCTDDALPLVDELATRSAVPCPDDLGVAPADAAAPLVVELAEAADESLSGFERQSPLYTLHASLLL